MLCWKQPHPLPSQREGERIKIEYKNIIKKEWIEKGFIDEPVQLPAGCGSEEEFLKAEIRKLCQEKDAIILAHYYTKKEIQEIADFIGDSLA